MARNVFFGASANVTLELLRVTWVPSVPKVPRRDFTWRVMMEMRRGHQRNQRDWGPFVMVDWWPGGWLDWFLLSSIPLVILLLEK